VNYLTSLEKKYCEGGATSTRCKAFAILRKHLPSALVGGAGAGSGSKRLHAHGKLNASISAFHLQAKKKRDQVRNAISMIIKNYCKKNSLFCLLMQGVKRNFNNSQKGGKYRERYVHFLNSLRQHYCWKPEQLASKRCAIFPILKSHQPMRKSKEKKHEDRAKDLLKAIETASAHYCKGKGQLMCRVAKDIKKHYVLSLKPGNRLALEKYLIRVRKNFCSNAKSTSSKRCMMIDVFWKHMKQAQLRPNSKAVAAPTIAVHSTPTPTPSPKATKVSASISGSSTEARAQSLLSSLPAEWSSESANF